MTALLRLVPDVVDHSAGAAQAQNTLAEQRKHDLRLVDPIPCERCGAKDCGREAAWSRYDTLLMADTPESDQDEAFEVWVVLDKRCAANTKVPMRFVAVIPAADIETDEHGYVVPCHHGARVDAAWDREKERRL